MSKISTLTSPMFGSFRTRKRSFWDTLTDREKAEAVNRGISRAFHEGLTAWDAAGKIKDAWNNTIYPNVVKPLIRDNEAKIFGSERRGLLPLIICWMVGKHCDVCHPAIVFVCPIQKVANRAIGLFKESEDLERFGFRYYHFPGAIRRYGGTDVMEPEVKYRGYCGTPIAIGFNFTKATVGGVVKINGSHTCALTTAHPFLLDSEDHQNSENETQAAAFDPWKTRVYSVDAGYSIHKMGKAHLRTSDEPPTEPKLLGHMCDDDELVVDIHSSSQQSIHRKKHQRLDWALIKLRDPGSILNVVRLPNGRFLFPIQITKGFPKGQLWVSAGGKQAVATTASETIGGVLFPEYGLQDLWALNLVSEPGDCGGWVVDDFDASVFGSVIAGCELLGVTLIMPFKAIFDNIVSSGISAELPMDALSKFLISAAEDGEKQLVEQLFPQLMTAPRKIIEAISAAARNRHPEIVQTLLRGFTASNPGKQDIALAVKLATGDGHLEVMHSLLDISGTALRDNRGTALRAAASRGHVLLVQSLVQDEDGVGVDDYYLNESLEDAVSHGHEVVAKLLLKHGARVKPDTTAVINAALGGHLQTVQLLIDQGANVNLRNSEGQTALHSAISRADEALVRLLLQSGAQPNTKLPGYSTKSVLSAAVVNGHSEIVRMLIDHGAEVVEDDLVKAYDRGFDEILDLLEKRKC